MRSLCTKLLAVALLALLAFPVLAQDERPGGRGGPRGPGGRGGFGSPGMMLQGPMLLQLKSVRQELNLTQEQADELRKKGQEVREKYRDQLQKARTGEDPQEAQKVFREMRDAQTKAVGEVLKPEQAKRFRQIQMQVRVEMEGPRALLRSDDWRELDLSPKQREDVKEIADELDKDRRELFRDARGDREKMAEVFKKGRQLTQKANERALKDLTQVQRDKWQELTGKKFQINPEELRGLRPGGPGGRRGPGGPRGDRPPRPQPRDE